MDALHDAHQGIERTKRRARQTVWWPGMNSDIVNTVGNCSTCQEHRPSQPQKPMVSDPPPSRIFEDVSSDLFSHAGRDFFVYVDRLDCSPALLLSRLLSCCKEAFWESLGALLGSMGNHPCCERTQSAWRPGGAACRPCQAAGWPGPSAGWNVTGRRGRRSPSRGTTPLVHCGAPGLTVWSDWLATYHVCVVVPVRDGRGSVLQCFAQYRRLRESRLSPGRWSKLSQSAIIRKDIFLTFDLTLTLHVTS